MRFPTLRQFCVFLALLLSACGSSGTQVKVDGNAVHVETSEGSATLGGNTLPADWPTDVAVYAGATITYAASVNPQSGKPGNALVLTTADSAEKVAAYYKDMLKTNSWTTTGMMESVGTSIITATKADRTLSLMVSTSGGVTGITIGVEQGK